MGPLLQQDNPAQQENNKNAPIEGSRKVVPIFIAVLSVLLAIYYIWLITAFIFQRYIVSAVAICLVEAICFFNIYAVTRNTLESKRHVKLANLIAFVVNVITSAVSWALMLLNNARQFNECRQTSTCDTTGVAMGAVLIFMVMCGDILAILLLRLPLSIVAWRNGNVKKQQPINSINGTK
jgi:CDP-diglyceride synthetase